MNPLYWIPESGLHWYLTYFHDHLERLGMHSSALYPCVLYKHDAGGLSGIIPLQVNDPYGIGTDKFLKWRRKQLLILITSPARSVLDPRLYLTFRKYTGYLAA